MTKPERQKNAQELELLQRLRALAARLPEVAEAVDGFGHTSFRVAKKPFVITGSEAIHLAIKTDPVTQDSLIRTGLYERTPYIGQHGWVSITDLDRVPWPEIEELVREAYRLVAPKRLARLLENAE